MSEPARNYPKIGEKNGWRLRAGQKNEQLERCYVWEESRPAAVNGADDVAPLVATSLIAATGDSLSPSYYLIFTALLSLVALMAIQSRSRRAAGALARTGALAVP